MENQELLDMMIYTETDEGMILRGVKSEYRDEIDELIIPESWNVINIQKENRYYSPDCFGFMKKLKKVVLPSTLKRLDFNAFRGCKELDDISLPTGIERMGFSPFIQTKYWNDNSNWDENGTLYIGNYLIHSSYNGLSLRVREGTTLIASCACTELNISELILPESLLYICRQAFYSCKYLRKVIIPSSIRYIDEEAFSYCDNLQLENVGTNVFSIDMKDDEPYLSKEKRYLSLSKLEEMLKELEDYNIEIETENESSYENYEGEDEESRYTSKTIYEIDFKEHASSLAFLNDNVYGLVFTRRQDLDPKIDYYLFPFVSKPMRRLILGYSASHSSNYLVIKNVRLVKKDNEKHPKLKSTSLYEMDTSL